MAIEAFRRFRARTESSRSGSTSSDVQSPKSSIVDKKLRRQNKRIPSRGKALDDADEDFECRGYRNTNHFISFQYEELGIVDLNDANIDSNAIVLYPQGQRSTVTDIIKSFPRPPHLLKLSSMPQAFDAADPFFWKPLPQKPKPIRPTNDAASLLPFFDQLEQIDREDFFRTRVPQLAKRRLHRVSTHASSVSLPSGKGRRAHRPRPVRGPPVASSAGKTIQLQQPIIQPLPLTDSRPRKLSNSSASSHMSRVMHPSTWKFPRHFGFPKKKAPTA